jgi:hypothetical protein
MTVSRVAPVISFLIFMPFPLVNLSLWFCAMCMCMCVCARACGWFGGCVGVCVSSFASV